MNLPLLAILAFFLQVVLSTQEKCSDPSCNGAEKLDPACKLGHRRTVDYGVTYYCMEDLLNFQYPGCSQSGGVFVEDCQGSDCVQLMYTDRRSFICRDNTCIGSNLKSYKDNFYCFDKVDLNCRLKRRLTYYREGVKTSQCLEEVAMSGNIFCPGLWQICEVGKNCPTTKTWEGFQPNEAFYCEGTGCSSPLDFIDLKYQCRDVSCKYFPESDHPLKWAFNTAQNKWICQDESSKCGQVGLWNDKYVCQPKSSSCAQDYLIDCSSCDPQQFDCRVDYPGWCCQTEQKTWTAYGVYLVPLGCVILLVIIMGWNMYRKQKLNKELSANGSEYHNSQVI